jgi:hypothetical protein
LTLLATGFVVLLTHCSVDSDGPPRAAAVPVVTIDPSLPASGSRVSQDFIDVVSSGGFDASDLSAIDVVSRQSGAHWLAIARATIQMAQINRGTTVVKSSPPGMFFPMDSVAVDPGAVADTMGDEVATAIARGDVVMSRTSAAVEGADVGDVVNLRAWDGSPHSLTVGAVVDDQTIVDAEFVFAQQVGAALGVTRPSRIRFVGSRAQLLATLAALPRGTRATPSWLPRSADEAISEAQTKQLLGEFAYSRTDSGDVLVDPAWKAAYLVTEKFPLIGVIECNRVVAAAAIAALNEIRQSGLSGHVNSTDTYRNGGCYGPREQKSSDGTSGRTLSRHSWGGAIDINPSANPQGAKPSMDQRLIAIFRRHGFVWGGNFPTPDGMHFEYVGR